LTRLIKNNGDTKAVLRGTLVLIETFRKFLTSKPADEKFWREIKHQSGCIGQTIATAKKILYP